MFLTENDVRNYKYFSTNYILHTVLIHKPLNESIVSGFILKVLSIFIQIFRQVSIFLINERGGSFKTFLVFLIPLSTFKKIIRYIKFHFLFTLHNILCM